MFMYSSNFLVLVGKLNRQSVIYVLYGMEQVIKIRNTGLFRI